MKINKLKLEKIIKYGVIGIVIIVFIILGFSGSGGDKIIINGKENTFEYYKVEVIGEVKNPGIYNVQSGNCISDIIRISGGLTKTGSVKGINLATEVSEGMRIIIPKESESDNKVNLNNCNLEDLISLGLSKSKAQSIINYRIQKTWISYIDEIKKISGITESDFNQIKEFITL